MMSAFGDGGRTTTAPMRREVTGGSRPGAAGDRTRAAKPPNTAGYLASKVSPNRVLGRPYTLRSVRVTVVDPVALVGGSSRILATRGEE